MEAHFHRRLGLPQGRLSSSPAPLYTWIIRNQTTPGPPLTGRKGAPEETATLSFLLLLLLLFPLYTPMHPPLWHSPSLDNIVEGERKEEKTVNEGYICDGGLDRFQHHFWFISAQLLLHSCLPLALRLQLPPAWERKKNLFFFFFLWFTVRNLVVVVAVVWW